MTKSENPTIMNHVSVGTDNLAAAGHFYDQIMAPLGATRLIEPGFRSRRLINVTSQ